jgi:hypothetical protein
MLMDVSGWLMVNFIDGCFISTSTMVSGSCFQISGWKMG